MITSLNLPPVDGRNGLNQNRAFTPRERMAVPGNPQAESHRPNQAPGIIPVANVSAQDSQKSSDLLDEVEEKKRADIDYQIILRVLAKKEEPTETTQSQPGTTSAKANVQSNPKKQYTSPPEVTENVPRANNPTNTQQVSQSDPLIFDLDGDGIETTGIKQGTQFDINADGRQDQVSFVSGGDAFLALDKNGNGLIDDGKELFGDQNGATNGFEELRKYDQNLDGMINTQDDIYEQLQLFSLTDSGHQQLRSLSESGISAISLGYTSTQIALNQYDEISEMSHYIRDDGTSEEVGDALLGFSQQA